MGTGQKFINVALYQGTETQPLDSTSEKKADMERISMCPPYPSWGIPAGLLSLDLGHHVCRALQTLWLHSAHFQWLPSAGTCFSVSKGFLWDLRACVHQTPSADPWTPQPTSTGCSSSRVFPSDESSPHTMSPDSSPFSWDDAPGFHCGYRLTSPPLWAASLPHNHALTLSWHSLPCPNKPWT